MDGIELTEQEKQFLVMLYNIGQNVIETTSNELLIDHNFFDRNDLFNLFCKLGVEDYI